VFDLIHKRNVKDLPTLLRVCLEYTQFVQIRWFLTQIATEVAIGMNYLHERDILHRDLTSSNILLDSKLTAKVCLVGWLV